jgi:hypothetical protein
VDHQSPDEQKDDLENVPETPAGSDPDPGFYARALRRMPRWIALAAAVALPLAWWHGGALWAASFAVGAIGGYWNYVAVCRVADRLSQTVERTGRKPHFSPRSFLRLLFIAVAAFVIIRFTHINLAAAFMGLFTPAAAVVLEFLYELASRQT